MVQSPILVSKYSITSNYCISFWTTLTAPDASLSLTLNMFGKSASGAPTQNTVNLVTLTNLTQNKWTWYSMDIDRKSLINYHEFNLAISGETKKAKTVVAVDDIEVSHVSCDYGYRFKCADGTIIGADKLCNFKYDCPGTTDHSDEGILIQVFFQNFLFGY